MSEHNQGRNDGTFSFVTGSTSARIISSNRQSCIDVVREAYLAHEHGRSVNPFSLFLRFPDRPNDRIIALPAYIGQPWDVSGIKWIASYPDNVRKGFPRASAVLLLNSHDTGYPFACMEASIISAARTAASAALAAEQLIGPAKTIRTFAVIGAGLIARYVYSFLLGTGWDIENVVVFDIERAEAERFTTHVCEREKHSSLAVSDTLESAVSVADLVLFATVAAKPHFHDATCLKHNPVVLHISLRDIAPQLLVNAFNVVDDVDHIMRAETSVHLAETLTGSRDFISGTLAQVIEGVCRVDRSRPIFFSPFGLGVLDLAVGKWVYDQAVAAGDNINVPDFFYETQRV